MLSIIAYQTIEIVPDDIRNSIEKSLPKGCDIFDFLNDTLDNYLLVEKNEHFLAHAEGLIDGGLYTYKRDQNEPDYKGCYSYSTYGRYRSKLKDIAAAFDEKAFAEIINFADHQGVIGAKYSKKLANDFELYQHLADCEEDQYFREFYSDMRAIFSIAAKDGCVHYF